MHHLLLVTLTQQNRKKARQRKRTEEKAKQTSSCERSKATNLKPSILHPFISRRTAKARQSSVYGYEEFVDWERRRRKSNHVNEPANKLSSNQTTTDGDIIKTARTAKTFAGKTPLRERNHPFCFIQKAEENNKNPSGSLQQ